MATILVVDDRREHRRLTRQVLERAGHCVVETSDGQEALVQARARPPDLVLSDVMMPGMDGVTLCRRVQEDPSLRHVPFVFMTATFADARYRQFAAEVGAIDVLSKPVDARTLREAVEAALQRGASPDATQRLKSLDEGEFHARHIDVVSTKLEEKIAELEAANAQLRDGEMRLRGMLDAVVQTISKMVEVRDPYTTGHERRVGDLATAIGESMGFEADRLAGLRIGGYLHDVGKIAMPSEILSKPGRLSDTERALIRGHAEIGYEILAGIDFPWPIAEMALQHHERLDGSGYPRGLSGTAILPEARILAVADTVEAMTSHRPYRPAVGLRLALEEVESGRGLRYDAAAVDICLRLFRDGRFEFR